MKYSESLSNRVPNIIRRHTDHMKFVACMAFWFITFFHILSIPFCIIVCVYIYIYIYIYIFIYIYIYIYIWLCVLCAFARFCKLCSLIVMFMYSYSYCICTVLCILPCVLLFLTLDDGLLARSQYSEGPATGHLDTGFSWCPYA